MTDVAGARRAIADRWQFTDHFLQRLQHLLEVHRLIPADVHRAHFHFRLVDCLHQHVDQILDIEEIAGLLTIAEHGDRQTFLRPLAENADDPGIRRGRILAWAEDVEEAEDHRLQTMLATVEIEVVLAGQFVRGIRGQRGLWRVFVNRLAFAIVAVHRCARRVEHTLDPGLAHGFADIQGADEVALMRLHRIVHRRLHRSDCRQMRNGAAALRGLRDQRGIGDVTDDQFDLRVVQRQVAAFASRQIIENPHRMAGGEQCIRQVRADETGAAGD